MAWSKLQKQIAARACQASRISDDQRRDMILRQFTHARASDGRITSTAPKLSNQDFAQFMAIVESFAGGKILHFTQNYWAAQAADQYARMRRRSLAIASRLETAGIFQPAGEGLRGWIAKRVAKGETDRIEELDYHGLTALIVGLEAFSSQRGIVIPA